MLHLLNEHMNMIIGESCSYESHGYFIVVFCVAVAVLSNIGQTGESQRPQIAPRSNATKPVLDRYNLRPLYSYDTKINLLLPKPLLF